ncbi:MAG TPA: efflux RND transporter periplasmic adaptor subunit [Micavibrio sp.]|jgi:multidrug efflux system membrane fusion protein
MYVSPAESQTPGGPSKAMPVPVVAAAVVRQDIPIQIKVLGTTMPYQSVAIRSRIDSQIADVKFKDGDNVKKGDTLFLLDDRLIKAQLAQAQADMAGHKAQLINLQRQYERNQKLIKQEAISERSLDESKAAYDAQRAIVSADEAAVENILVQLAYTDIKAPIDGRTGTIGATVGNTVKANDTTPLVTINQIHPILVQASLPQDNFDAVRKALAVGIVQASATRGDGNNESLQGTLQYIDNAIDQGTGTFAIRAVFDNADEHLWPGMLATLTLKLGDEKQSLVVPEVAIQHDLSGNFVYAVNGGKAQKKAVTVSRIEDGIALVSGLEENEMVITDGLMSLKDGSAIAVSSPQGQEISKKP